MRVNERAEDERDDRAHTGDIVVDAQGFEYFGLRNRPSGKLSIYIHPRTFAKKLVQGVQTCLTERDT